MTVRIYIKEMPIIYRILGIRPGYLELVQADHAGDFVEISDDVTKIKLSKSLKRDTKFVSWRQSLKETNGYEPLYLGGYSVPGGHYHLSEKGKGKWWIEAEANTLESILAIEKIMRAGEELVTEK